ncbi:MAG: hypothetical protein PHW04_04240 [Candidatus Wallbacteria bacterium]|nr:hypothetical protein [Candidatus Wallbacteria bacterium]
MKLSVLICLLGFSAVFACPAFTLKDSTYNDIKRASSKLFFGLVAEINKFEDTGTGETETLKTRWDGISLIWVQFQTRLENWLNMIPANLGREEWIKALNDFQRRISDVRKQIRSGSVEVALSDMAEIKIELLLFFHYNFLDAAKNSAVNGDKALLKETISDITWLKNLPPSVQEFQKRISELYNNFDDTHRKEFIEWKEKMKVQLKKDLSEYFEKNSWY